MAWGEVKVDEQRKKFCKAVLENEISISQACRQHEISRPTAYHWLERYKQEGEKGLITRSSARKTQGQQFHPEIIEEVLNIKYKFKYLGPKKIHAKLLEIYPHIHWPSITTIANILTKNGLTKARKRIRRLPINDSGLSQSNEPNEVWSMDFKGWHITSDGYKFDPFTLSDHYSRYLLRCLKLDFNNGIHVWNILECAFREYGLPKFIRSDNGPPFSTCSPGRLSSLAIKLIKAGVMPEWIEPGKPQQNGRHERMHLTMKQESFNKNLSLKDQQAKLKEFLGYYNFERPHEALDQKSPGSVYTPSNRTWTGKFREIEYPKDNEIGWVKSCGKVSFKGREVYIGRVLSGETIGLKPIEDGYEAYFSSIYLGKINRNGELEVPRRQMRIRKKQHET